MPFHKVSSAPDMNNSSNARGLTKQELSQLLSLQSFVKSGNEAEVKRLVKHKTRLDSLIGGEILWDAVLSDEIEIAKILVKSGACLMVVKPNDELHDTFLHELVRRNSPRHHQLAMLMIERGASINRPNWNGLMVLEYAIRKKLPVERITDFLKCGTSVSGKCIADAGRHPAAAELIPLLLAGFVDVETRNRRVVEALFHCSSHWITDSRALPVVKIIVDAKFMSVEKIEDGGFSVRPAVETNKPSLVRLLIKHGFDVNKQAPRGPLPLYAASKLKQSTIAEMLIRAGANVNALSAFLVFKRGYAIHAACEKMSFKNIQLLLHYGADLSVVNRSGDTPLSMSRFISYVNATSTLPVKRLARNPCLTIDNLRHGAAHRMLIKYLALQIAKGQAINNCDLNHIEKNAGMNDYYNECLRELEMMKLTKIIGEISFFFILAKSAGELAFAARNYHFLKKYDESKRKNNFPVYCEEMDFVITNAITLKESVRDREEALRDSLEINLPYIPLENIIYYFYLGGIK